MHQILKSLAIAGLVATSVAAQPVIVGYFPYWAQYSQFFPKDIRTQLVTHVHYGYLVPSGSDLAFADGTDQPNFEALAKLGNEKDIQVVASIGGPGNADAVKTIAESEESSRALATAAAAFVKKYDIAGIEIDWQVTDEADGKALGTLLSAFLQNFGGDNQPILTATVLGTTDVLDKLPIQELARLDYVTVQFTDEIDASASTLHPNSNLVAAQGVLSELAKLGIPKEKLVPVVPFYGKSFTGATGLGTAVTGVGSGNDGILSYQELMQKLDGPTYSVSFDSASASEVAVGAGEAIVFTGIPSVRTMAQYVKDNGLGGMGGFDLSGDHPQPLVSLLVTIGKVLRPEIDYKAKKH